MHFNCSINLWSASTTTICSDSKLCSVGPRDWGEQTPSVFIPIAEESGLIVPIGAWVLETACKTAAAWAKPLKVAVNLSPVQFRHGDIVATVERALSVSGLAPMYLELESRRACG